MASLLGSLPHTPSPSALPYEFSKPLASRTLLNLDCSADLTSYSRSLGPVLPDRKIAINDETVPMHIEDHRDHVLRSRESSLRPGGGPQIQAQAQAQAFGYPPSSLAHASVPHTNSIHEPTPRPQPAQFLLQRPLSTAPSPALPKSRSPIPGHPSTYPPALLAALDESSRRAAEPPYSNVVFQVIEQIDSTYGDDSTNIVGTYKTLHSANHNAVEYFIREYGGCVRQEGGSDVNLHHDGSLELKIETDGSTGGLCTVYTRRSTVRD